MKQSIISISFVILVGLFITLVSQAADNATVTATVTAQNIAISVADGSITYGTIALGGAASTTADSINDSQTVTNDGNITSDLDIRGQNTAAWTLAGSSGADQYIHQFCGEANCDSAPVWTALTTSYQALATSIAAAGTKVFDLKITLPASSSSYTQQSVDVTVLASAS